MSTSEAAGGTASIRLFVAVFPPADIARRLLKIARAMRLPDHRAVPVAQVHMTLLFIGSTSPDRLRDIKRATSDVCARHEPPLIGIDRVCTLPRGDRPRLLAAMCVEHPGLADLHRDVASALVGPLGLSKPHRFTPHLTLCRFRRGARARRQEEQVSTMRFTASEVAVVRSDLSSEGAVYTTMCTAPLLGVS